MKGYVNGAYFFADHAKVLNETFDSFTNVLGDKADHISIAVGCTRLPRLLKYQLL